MKKTVLPCLLLLLLASCGDNSGHSPQPADHSTHKALKSGYADSVNKGLIAPDTLKGSPTRELHVMLNGVHVEMIYGSPGVRGRVIWGGLVPYDEVWASGAHRATSIEFDKDVLIGDQRVAAGKYAFFTIPGREAWTVILNSRWDQHLADEYDDKEDVLRVKVIPETPEVPVQRLTYAIEKDQAGQNSLVMAWENVKLRLPISAAP